MRLIAVSLLFVSTSLFACKYAGLKKMLFEGGDPTVECNTTSRILCLYKKSKGQARKQCETKIKNIKQLDQVLADFDELNAKSMDLRIEDEEANAAEIAELETELAPLRSQYSDGAKEFESCLRAVVIYEPSCQEKKQQDDFYEDPFGED
jgi:hypothetical protein